MLSIDKKGELKQFLPGKIYFEISQNTLTFGKLGYITDEEILINWINKDKVNKFALIQFDINMNKIKEFDKLKNEFQSIKI